MIVYKFGGTSVGTPQRMRNVAALLPENASVFLVLSATSGTTNRLCSISSACFARQYENALDQMQELNTDMLKCASELLTKKESLEQARAYFKSQFDEITVMANPDFDKASEKIFLSKGELFSTYLTYLLLKEQERPVTLLPALDFMKTDAEDQPDFGYITEKLNSLVDHNSKQIYLTQGYICRDVNGAISNLKRGGSDYTASIIGAVSGSSEIVIWTDIDGLHNNDPRYVEGTSPVRVLSFEEADELACFGAKILHPQTIQPARRKGIPVRLKNTMQPDAEGTLIGPEPRGEGIKAIAAKDGITVVRINSGRMLMAYGFLRAVFSIFEKYRTPIDMITTSEVAVSLTIDDDRHLYSILPELEQLGQVQVDVNQTIICVAGHNIGSTKGIAAAILNSLRDVPLRMISGGGSQHNLSVLIDSHLKQQALYALQQGLFSTKNATASNPLAGTITA
jgi:aspartate kinase